MSDFFVYAALPIGVVLGAPSQARYVILIVMLGIFYINTASWMYLAAILEKRAAHDPETTTTIIMPTGLVGGFETIVFFSLISPVPCARNRLFPGLYGLGILQHFPTARVG